jgi:hypothetical protein
MGRKNAAAVVAAAAVAASAVSAARRINSSPLRQAQNSPQ